MTSGDAAPAVLPSLRTVRAMRTEFETPLTAIDMISPPATEQGFQTINFTLGDEYSGPQPGSDPEPGTHHIYVVRPEFECVFGARDDDGNEVVIARCAATYEVVYALADDQPGLDVLAADNFLTTTTPLVVWPYIRHLVQQQTAGALLNIPPLALLEIRVTGAVTPG